MAGGLTAAALSHRVRFMSVFCEACQSASRDDTPGNISTFNGIGRTFYGGADRCEHCGSVVRTLWFVFAGIPLIPMGSYRYKAEDDRRFRSRRTATHWPQIFWTWLLGWAIGAVVIYVISRMNSK